jgi:BlaR1 peptidase M56
MPTSNPNGRTSGDALQRQAGLRQLVPLAVAEEAGPLLCRLPGGYRLIVPRAHWQLLEPSQRLLVLRHELAHIQRRDVWKSLGMRVLALPHWFNPLVWQIIRQFDECAEWACDEAAAQSAPEQIPNYARALLQLVSRSRPVFFATRAAREGGLAYRIRRMLQPAKEKGANMKKAAIAVLVLGITIAGVAKLRLQRPAHSVVSKAEMFREPLAAQAEGVATATSKLTRHAVTVMAPHSTTEMVRTETGMVPVIRTEMVPETRIVDDNGPLPTPAPIVPVADPIGSLARREMLPAENAAPVPTSTQRGETARTADAPQLAKVNLEYVLKGMQEYQRERRKLFDETQNLKKSGQAARAQMLTTAQERISHEKDPMMKEIIDKGMTQKLIEMVDEENTNIGNRMSELKGRMRGKILREVASCAKEHHLLVVRRVDNDRRDGESFVPAERLGLRIGEVREPAPTPGAFEARSGRQRQAWQNDVLYSADDITPKEIDISDEIIDRLNRSSDEKQPFVQPGA